MRLAIYGSCNMQLISEAVQKYDLCPSQLVVANLFGISKVIEAYGNRNNIPILRVKDLVDNIDVLLIILRNGTNMSINNMIEKARDKNVRTIIHDATPPKMPNVVPYDIKYSIDSSAESCEESDYDDSIRSYYSDPSLSDYSESEDEDPR